MTFLLRGALALACALPWLARSLPIALAKVVDAAFFPLCHHVAGRVLAWGPRPMCVCSRCAGLYAGLAIGLVLGGPDWEDRTWKRLLAVALGLTLADVVTQDLHLHAPSHPTRLLTGAALGWVASGWMVRATSRSRRSPGRLLPD